MTAFKHKLNDRYLLVISTLAVVFVLTLTTISIHLLVGKENEGRGPQKKKVLGTSMENNEKSFWIEFIAENPYYYPGLKRLNEISIETNDIKLQEETKMKLIKLKPIEE